MTQEQIDAVARRAVEILRAEREGAARARRTRAALLDVIQRAEAGLDLLDGAMVRIRRGVELGEF